MKKLRVLTIFIITISALVFCLNYNTLATVLMDDEDSYSAEMPEGTDGVNLINEDGENTPVVTSNEEEIGDVHNGDLYVIADTFDYTMDKKVDGNVFIIGNNVKVTGEINGSLFVLASKIEIDTDAYVACHFFAGANDIYINGMILDVYSMSNTLSLGDDAIIYRQLIASAEDVFLTGAVGRDVNLYTDKMQINREKLSIYGDLNYEALEEVENIDECVEGNVKFNQISVNKENIGSVIWRNIFSAIGTIIFDVVLYLALMFFAPKFIEKAKEYVSTKALLALAIGLAVLVALPIIAFLLIFTVVLQGFSILAFALYFAILMVNSFIVTIVINEFASNKLNIEDKFKKVGMLAIISAVLWGIRKIPFIGALISAIVCLCGVGIVILYQFDRRKN